MNRQFAYFLLATAFLFPTLSQGAMYGLPDDKSLKIKVGDVAPLGQGAVKKAHDDGKGIILMFGDPGHCIFCEKTWEAVNIVAPKYSNDATAFIKNYRLADFNPPAAEDVELAAKYGVVGEPWIFIIDKTGIVRTIFKGVTNSATLDAELSKLFPQK
jgi:thioredoxin-related protein